MKRFFLFPLFALALAGCNDQQISSSARWSVDHISYTSAGYGGSKYGDFQRGMHHRQQQWDFYNRHKWGRQPAWKGESCLPSEKASSCRSIRISRGPAVMMARYLNVPPLGKEDEEIYRRMGKAHQIHSLASVRLMEALNRAAVGDFGGLKALGLSPDSLAFAQQNGGRLDAAGLTKLGHALNLSARGTAELVQSIIGSPSP